MKILVTGADGFVGRHLVPALLAAGHTVTAASRPGLESRVSAAVRVQAFEVSDRVSVQRVVALDGWDAVVHLAAVASGGDALADPGVAWEVNAGGTARLVGELGLARRAGAADPVVLVVSTAEVYDARGRTPLVETSPLRPCSPYAASKRGAELAAWETAGRTGLRVIVARPFPHTGPGQDERFVAPAFARRLRGARLARARVVKVGNLEPVRDLLDVRDVAAAYLALVERGTPGETYNVASGEGVSLDALFRRLAALAGVDAIPEPDPELMRPADLPFLVGDASKLRSATGWAPERDLDTTLRDLVNAQAD